MEIKPSRRPRFSEADLDRLLPSSGRRSEFSGNFFMQFLFIEISKKFNLNFENSKMVCKYRELITCMYRIDVRASHYKISPPLLITCTDYRLNRQTVVPPARVARPSVIASSQWPLRESGTLFR